MWLALNKFWKDERGKALVEYTLLITFGVCLVFGFAGYFYGGIAGITTFTNGNLSAASAAAK